MTPVEPEAATVRAEPCACQGPSWPCLLHWSLLSPVERMVVARRLGLQLPALEPMSGHVRRVVAKVSRTTGTGP